MHPPCDNEMRWDVQGVDFEGGGQRNSTKLCLIDRWLIRRNQSLNWRMIGSWCCCTSNTINWASVFPCVGFGFWTLNHLDDDDEWIPLKFNGVSIALKEAAHCHDWYATKSATNRIGWFRLPPLDYECACSSINHIDPDLSSKFQPVHHRNAKSAWHLEPRWQSQIFIRVPFSIYLISSSLIVMQLTHKERMSVSQIICQWERKMWPITISLITHHHWWAL